MLFHSSLRKELARSFGATLVVLVTIVMTMTLIRTLGQATRGSVNPSEVMMVHGLHGAGLPAPILTLSLFIAIVGTLSRMYRDSEMVIWFSSGRGLAGFLLAAVRFAWPVLVVIAVLALVALALGQPANAGPARPLRASAATWSASRPASSRSRPAAAACSSSTRTRRQDRSGRNIFISTNERGRETVTSARSGPHRDHQRQPVPAAGQRPAAGNRQRRQP
jgi:lipopolysaccharide export system permease protein